MLANQANAARRNFGTWKCATCAVEKPATVHQMRKTYCSNQCMSVGYSTRMVGASNPHFSDAGARVCAQCGGAFHSYKKDRKFCSRECSVNARPKKEAPPVKTRPAKKVRPIFVPRSTDAACAQCRTSFKKYPSQKKMFCSYQCHLDSGGAFRAGMAASKATMKYGPRKDANHNEIFEELRKHCAIYDLSAAGRGIPDGLAWINGSWHLFDVKNPNTGYGKRGLNAVQTKWVQQWKGGPVFLIYTSDEAKRFAVGQFDGLKSVQCGGAE